MCINWVRSNDLAGFLDNILIASYEVSQLLLQWGHVALLYKKEMLCIFLKTFFFLLLCTIKMSHYI